MRFLSLFSGIGGFDLALERAGMECVGQVEIDPQCRRVLERHWPQVTRYEDVRTVLGGRRGDSSGHEDLPLPSASTGSGEWESASIDLICGGFPCQDLSVAGRRAGLDGARSGLWFEFQRIVSEVRPRYVLVENVPGLLSSNEGRDFAVIIDGLGELGYGVSWTVLDAQHFGVPQRRRRVFIVAGPPDGRTEAILAIAEGCAGHPAAGRTAGKGLAAEVGDGLAKSLRARANASHREDSDTYVPELITAPTIDTHLGDKQWLGDQDVENFLPVMDAIAVRTAQTSSNGWGVDEEVAYTLDETQGQAVVHSLTADGFDASEDGTGRGTPLVAVANTLNGNSGRRQIEETYVPQSALVRRLTPTECLRLQAFPDDWLDLDPPLSDGPKYRMCGNAVTVSVVEWIGRRIMAASQEDA